MTLNASHCTSSLDKVNNLTGCYSLISINMCWEAAGYNETRTQYCPITEFEVTRTCTPQGWRPSPKALFHICLQSALRRQRIVNAINYSGYPLTILVCGFALGFLSLSTKLRKRFHNLIHLNLYLSLMLYAVISLTRPLIIANVAEVPPVGCLFLRLFTVYLSASRFTWLCAEGIFMFYSLFLPFKEARVVRYVVWIVGWGLPALIAGAFVSVVHLTVSEEVNNSSKCHLPDNSYLTYIVEVPIAIIMVANFCLATYVLRVTWKKLKEYQNHTTTNTAGRIASESSKRSGDDNDSIATAGTSGLGGSITALSMESGGTRCSQTVGRFIRKQRYECTRWARMSRSSIIVGLLMGLHFVPAILPYEQIDKRSPSRFHLRLLNALLHAYSGLLIGGVSFYLKPEVRNSFYGYWRSLKQCGRGSGRCSGSSSRRRNFEVVYQSRSSRATKSVSINMSSRINTSSSYKS